MSYKKPKLTNQELQHLKTLLQSDNSDFVWQGIQLWEAVLAECSYDELQEQIKKISGLRDPGQFVSGFTLDHRKKLLLQKFPHHQLISLWLLGKMAGYDEFAEKNSRFNFLFLKHYHYEFPESLRNLKHMMSISLEITTKELPASIENFAYLRTLKINGRKLEGLPETIGNLSLLQVFNLSANRLRSLPDSIGKLSALEELNLTDNRLQVLPETIGMLRNLRKLILRHNELQSLPNSIQGLKHLRVIDVRGNPWSPRDNISSWFKGKFLS